MDSPSPLAHIMALRHKSDFLFIVYYRGHWCPFCMPYITTLSDLSPAIIAAGGTPLIITAEPASFLAETRSKTGYHGEAIVDPHHEIATVFRKRGWVDVAISERKGYVDGMSQPAILVIEREGDKILETWAIVPSVMNLNGGKDRPHLDQVWDNVRAKREGRAVVHGTYKLGGFVKMVCGKIFG